MGYWYLGIDVLKGEILNQIKRSHNEIHFYTESGKHYIMYHSQDCCESVTIDDIDGDLNDLLGSPIIIAEECTSNSFIDADPDRYVDGSETWTFYKLATDKATVKIRWYGTSNGYYSENVDIIEVTAEC